MSDDLDSAWADLRPNAPIPDPTPCCAVCGYIRPDDAPPPNKGDRNDMHKLELKTGADRSKDVTLGTLVVCGHCIDHLAQYFYTQYERERIRPLRRKLAQLEEAVSKAASIAQHGPYEVDPDLKPEPEPESEGDEDTYDPDDPGYGKDEEDIPF